MNVKRKKSIAHFMAFMTLFMSVFTLTYTVMYCRSLIPNDSEKDLSDTLYRRLAATDFEKDKSTQEPENTGTAKGDEGSPDAVKKQSDEKSGSVTSGDKTVASSLFDIEFVNVRNADTGEIFCLPLEEYVECVVLAEMPTNAPIEALKAQAVASRTLAVRFIIDADKRAHNGADICTSPAHCQSYKDIDVFSETYGEGVSDMVSNIKNAVKQTRGTVLVYSGEPIVAAFHASSGARTASGKEVWGGDVAYLVSVETDEMYNESLKGQVINTVSFNKTDFINALTNANFDGLEKYSDTPFSEWVSGITRTESGRASFINIAGEKIDGEMLRKILGLRSCDFSVSYSDNTISFTTVGYGHGVGMSQLGAVSMAMQGESFHSILSKYYPGCTAEIM